MKRALALFAVVVLAGLALLGLRRPSTDRDWSVDQAVLPHVEFCTPSLLDQTPLTRPAATAGTSLPFSPRSRGEGGQRPDEGCSLVTIRNIRNFRYASTSQYTPAYYDKTFDLRKLESVWFFVEPFGGAGAAHTFVSFGFTGGEFLAISIEIRKEKGESFSPVRGLLREYEVMYVIGDERDLVKLRTNYRKDDVFLYRIRATPERREEMFVSMLQRANELRQHPEFYNTLTNTCTTNLVKHVNTIVPGRIPFSPSVLLPASSDRLAYDLGLIETTLPFAQTRNAARINDLALRFAEDPAFSIRIRQ